MHNQLLSQLMEIIKTQNNIIQTLMGNLDKFLVHNPKQEPSLSLDYKTMSVDDPPVFEILQTLDYKYIIAKFEADRSRTFKPIIRKAGSTRVPDKLCCPQCKAPSIYLYANNATGEAFKCKVCNLHFNLKNKFNKQAVLRCPHCRYALDRIKQRADFDVFRCPRNDCSFYQKNLRSMTAAEKKIYQDTPQKFKLRYIYRSFKLDLVPLSKEQYVPSKVDLAKIHSSPETLGLILTYYINYGLSARRTSALMWDVHRLKISHQTVLNYASALKPLFNYFVANYPYKLSNSFCGDETYIRVRGKWHYICFFFDAISKIILAHPISSTREPKLAITAINDLLTKMQEIPKDLNLIVDGNPIYLIAQQFFAERGINFDVTQVAGLTNDDPISTKYRPLKNIIERLNRTYKTSYRQFFGFGSHHGAESFTALFVAFFNFLRPHSALDGNVPVMLKELSDSPNMPASWQNLIQIAQNFVLLRQLA